MKFAIVVSRFNSEVTEGLLQGALKYLEEKNVDDVKVFKVPGAFEIPLVAQRLAHQFDGIVCLGAVIKGDTAHFEFISLGASQGLMQAMLATETPMGFGILTAYNDDQATARSQADAQNKGREAAAACLETAELLQSLH